MNRQPSRLIQPPPRPPPSPLTVVATFFHWVHANINTCSHWVLAFFNACFFWAHAVWEYANEERDYMGAMGAEAVLVTAIMMCAFNLQIFFNPPGGVYLDTLITGGKIVHQLGKAVAIYENRVEYRHLFVANIISMTCNLVIFVLYVTRVFLRRRLVSFLLMVTLYWTTTAAAYTIKMAIQIITPNHDQESQREWDYVIHWTNGCLILLFAGGGISSLVLVSKLLKL